MLTFLFADLSKQKSHDTIIYFSGSTFLQRRSRRFKLQTAAAEKTTKRRQNYAESEHVLLLRGEKGNIRLIVTFALAGATFNTLSRTLTSWTRYLGSKDKRFLTVYTF